MARKEYTVPAGGQATFTYDFRIFTSSDIKVYARDPSDTESSDSRDGVLISGITGVGDAAGGSVTIASQVEGTLVTLVSDIPIERQIEYLESADCSAENLNDEYDKIIAILKQTDANIRGLKFKKSATGITDGETGFTISDPKAGEYLRYRSDGLGIESSPLLKGTADGILTISGDGVNNADPANPQITSVIGITGDRLDVTTDSTNPVLFPQIIPMGLEGFFAGKYWLTLPYEHKRVFPRDEVNMLGVIITFFLPDSNESQGGEEIWLGYPTTRGIYKRSNVSGALSAIEAGDIVGRVFLQLVNEDGYKWEVLLTSATETEIARESGVMALRAHVSIADVNNGYELLPAVEGYTYRIVSARMIATSDDADGADVIWINGTQWWTDTSLFYIEDTMGTMLLHNEVTFPQGASLGAGFGKCGVNTPITCGKTGDDITGTANIDFLIEYLLERE